MNNNQKVWFKPDFLCMINFQFPCFFLSVFWAVCRVPCVEFGKKKGLAIENRIKRHHHSTFNLLSTLILGLFFLFVFLFMLRLFWFQASNEIKTRHHLSKHIQYVWCVMCDDSLIESFRFLLHFTMIYHYNFKFIRKNIWR